MSSPTTVPLRRGAPARLERPAWSDAAGSPVPLEPHLLPPAALNLWELVVTPGTDTEGWQYGTVFRWDRGLGKQAGALLPEWNSGPACSNTGYCERNLLQLPAYSNRQPPIVRNVI